jgi:hypothetical protein
MLDYRQLFVPAPPPSNSISHLINIPFRVPVFLPSSSAQDGYHQLDSNNDRI